MGNMAHDWDDLGTDTIFRDLDAPNDFIDDVDAGFVDGLLASLQTPAELDAHCRQADSQSLANVFSEPCISVPAPEPWSQALAGGPTTTRPPISTSLHGTTTTESIAEPLADHDERREKSKLAQRKFRQRQKERANAKGNELKEATQKLEALTLEREKLQQRNKMLELALLRINTPQGTGAASSESTDTYEPRCDSADLEDALSEISPQADKNLQVLFAAEDLENICIRMVTGRTYNFGSADVKKMTIGPVLQIWEEVVSSMAMLLTRANGNAHSAAGRHLQELVTGTLKFKCCMHMHHWRLKTQVATTRMGQPALIPDSQTVDFQWADILGAIKLEDWQKKRILELRSSYLASWLTITQERQALEQGLQALAVTADSTYGQTHQQIALRTLAERLGRLWQKTHACLVPYYKAVWREVLNPLQVAHFTVQSYPWMPDSLALAGQLAKEAGLPAGEEILATRFPAAFHL